MKAYQRVIRELKEKVDTKPIVDTCLLKSAVLPIKIETAQLYILQHEYLGKMPGWSRYAFGHYFGEIIGGVILLGDTTGSYHSYTTLFPKKKVIQLQRGVNLWWTPKNSASYFIARVCRWLKNSTDYDIVTATADESAGEIGTIYQALNWILLPKIQDGHPVFIIDGKEIHPKTLFDRHGTSNRDTIKQIYGDRLVLKQRQPKYRYVYFLRAKPTIKSLPYPKRDLTITLEHERLKDLPEIRATQGTML